MREFYFLEISFNLLHSRVELTTQSTVVCITVVIKVH